MEANASKKVWLMIDGYVVDATEFVKNGEHPGGEEILGSPLAYQHDRAKDATIVFRKNAGLNQGTRGHTDEAVELMKSMRIGKLDEDAVKRAQRDEKPKGQESQLPMLLLILALIAFVVYREMNKAPAAE